MIIDFRRSRWIEHSALCIGGEEVERVEHFKFLVVYITADLTWSANVSPQGKRAQQRL